MMCVLKVFDSGADNEGDSAHDDSAMDRLLRDVAHAPERALPFARVELPDRRVAGTVIADRYRLERRIGEGGMGTVWAARHTVTRRSVALKFLKTAPTDGSNARQRFIREARTASAIDHPSVIRVHDVFDVDDGEPVIVMELLEGETFGAKLLREGRLPLPELADIMLPVCSAVGKAHQLGIVHRDLKPENIFLETPSEADAGRTRVKVLDFGIAKLTALEGDAARSAGNTATGALVGTPFYMSPEQIFGEKDVDHRADIWALGILLYEALAGRRPTEAENVGQILKIITTDAIVPLRTLVPSTPQEVADLVARMLHRDREKRPSDLREVFGVLRGFSKESASTFGEPTSAGEVFPDAAQLPATPSEAPPRIALVRPASTLDSSVSDRTKAALRTRRGSLGPATYALVAVSALAMWGALRARPHDPLPPETISSGEARSDRLPTALPPPSPVSDRTVDGASPREIASASSAASAAVAAARATSSAAARPTLAPAPSKPPPKPASSLPPVAPVSPAPSSSTGASAPVRPVTHVDPGSYL